MADSDWQEDDRSILLYSSYNQAHHSTKKFKILLPVGCWILKNHIAAEHLFAFIYNKELHTFSISFLVVFNICLVRWQKIIDK